jgi:hypothetical protein
MDHVVAMADPFEDDVAAMDGSFEGYVLGIADDVAAMGDFL